MVLCWVEQCVLMGSYTYWLFVSVFRTQRLHPNGACEIPVYCFKAPYNCPRWRRDKLWIKFRVPTPKKSAGFMVRLTKFRIPPPKKNRRFMGRLHMLTTKTGSFYFGGSSILRHRSTSIPIRLLLFGYVRLSPPTWRRHGASVLGFGVADTYHQTMYPPWN